MLACTTCVGRLVIIRCLAHSPVMATCHKLEHSLRAEHVSMPDVSEAAQVYYYNTLTKESAWSKPEGYAGDESGVAKPTKPLSHERVKGTDWSQVKCEDGKVYYYNITSRVRLHRLMPIRCRR